MTSENETKVMENSTETAMEEKVENRAEETTENKIEEIAEETIQEEQSETVAEPPVETKEPIEAPQPEKDEKSTQEEFISEFAPAPIKIPNYNKEREMRKRVKIKEKNKKARSKKSRKRRRLIKKILVVLRSVVLFTLLLVLTTATVSTLYVKMNTSEYSVRKAIRDANPETFVVGEIETPEKMHLRESSKKASIADILRDNSMLLVTYGEIQGAVMRSTYPDFVAGVAHEIMNHYIYGTEYDGVEKKEIEEALLENASYIKTVTDREVGETASAEIAEYMMGSEEFKSLNPYKIANQEASQHTHITSILFSTMSLICFVIALLLFMVLTIMLCKGYAYKLIGWSAVLSGAVCAVLGFFFKPHFVPVGEFVTSVFEAITKSLNQSALVFGGITILVGILIMLVGSALKEEDDDEYEEEYIDEIEQVSTAQ